MKFSVLAFLTLAASVAAAPAPDADGHKMMKQFPIPNSMTVKQGQAKCGDGAQLSCCNKASYSGDTTHVGGTLSNLIGSGSASEGLGLFNQCSKLDAQVTALLLLGVQDILNQRCKQNIACCQKNPGKANGDLIGADITCVALGSLI